MWLLVISGPKKNLLEQMPLVSRDRKPPIVIRDASPDDAETMCKIRDEAWIDAYPNKERGITPEQIKINAQGLHGEFVPRRIKWLKDKIANADTNWKTFVGEIEGNVRGFIIVSNHDRGRQFINSVYVQPGFQSKGVGSKLMQTAFDWFDASEDIYLEVASYNNRAIRFYERFGFVKTDAVVPEEPDRPDYITPIPQIEMVLKAG